MSKSGQDPDVKRLGAPAVRPRFGSAFAATARSQATGFRAAQPLAASRQLGQPALRPTTWILRSPWTTPTPNPLRLALWLAEAPPRATGRGRLALDIGEVTGFNPATSNL